MSFVFAFSSRERRSSAVATAHESRTLLRNSAFLSKAKLTFGGRQEVEFEKQARYFFCHHSKT
jgi:hypothetical protein